MMSTSRITIEKNIYNILAEYEGGINDGLTRIEIQQRIQNYMNTIQRCTYVVRCNNTNNSPETIDRGKLIVNIDNTPFTMTVTFPRSK